MRMMGFLAWIDFSCRRVRKPKCPQRKQEQPEILQEQSRGTCKAMIMMGLRVCRREGCVKPWSPRGLHVCRRESCVKPWSPMDLRVCRWRMDRVVSFPQFQDRTETSSCHFTRKTTLLILGAWVRATYTVQTNGLDIRARHNSLKSV